MIPYSYYSRFLKKSKRKNEESLKTQGYEALSPGDDGLRNWVDERVEKG